MIDQAITATGCTSSVWLAAVVKTTGKRPVSTIRKAMQFDQVRAGIVSSIVAPRSASEIA